MGTRETFADLQSEKDFQAAVIEYARLRRWIAYHTYDSRRSAPGFPDCVFVRDGRLVFAELKSQTGRLTIEQVRWYDELEKVAEGTERVGVFVWRPDSWDAIEAALR